MNRRDERAGGVAFRCDANGRVLDVVLRDAGAPESVCEGVRLVDLVDAGSAPYVERLLATLRDQRAGYGWELTFPNAGRPVALHVAGSAVDGGFLVVGAASRSGVAELFDELSEGAASSPRPPRAAPTPVARSTPEDALYEELSRLNNELATSQRELAKSNAQLARLNEQKNRFLGMAAHDIRNPLDVIRIYSRFVIEDGVEALDPRQIEFLEIVEQSSGFLLGLVDDLLDISKIEAGRLDLDRSPVDLARLVERNVARNRVLAERKRVDLRLAADPDAPTLWIDAPKIEQVLNNLVGNAIKYSPDGSAVDVRVSADDESFVVSVTNPGHGIAEGDLETIFDAFVTGRARGTAGERSTGLGLAIAKRIVEGHGGRICAESAPGGDTTFTFTLPSRAAAAPTKGS